MPQSPQMLRETPSQTAGPYVHIGCTPGQAGLHGIYAQDIGLSPVTQAAMGPRIEIAGSVQDGLGWVLKDALLESWQADHAGRYPGEPGADPGMIGFCRFAVDGETGLFTLRTIRPGPVRLPNGALQAPHIALWLVARGINTGLATRIYFEDQDNGTDPLLTRIEMRPRVDTLIARKTGEGTYRFDIRLQGPGETVFLDL